MHRGQERLRHLDGLRGVAILLVAAWHYLGPIYAMHLPYGQAVAAVPGIRHGWAGVDLFFLISGYVIFLTLERCRGFVDFMLRRWLRLFPAMLVASLLIFAAAQPLAALMPGGRAAPVDLLPGLAFVPPFFLTRWLGVPVRSLDGAFWSLHVEMIFYLVIGLLYYRLGWRRATAGLIALYAAALALPYIVHATGSVPLRHAARWATAAGFGYFGWFASGALFLKARQHGDRGLLAMAGAIGLAAALTTPMPGGLERSARAALLLCVPGFAAVLHWRPLQRLLEGRPAQLLGAVSYPFYLVHSAVGIGLIALAVPRLRPLPWPVAPALVLAAMLALAWAIARYAEPALTRRLRPATDAVRQLLGARRSSVAPPLPGQPA